MLDSILDVRTDHVSTNIDFNIRFSEKEDILSSKYKIHIHHEVTDLSNDFIKYYLASDLNSNSELYAIVYDRGFLPNIDLIKSIALSENSIFIRPIDAGFVKISLDKIFRFVVIVQKYDYNKNLYKKKQAEGVLGSKEINSTILTLLASAIKFAEDKKFCIGNINSKNILVFGESYLIREPYISLPNFYQPDSYVPLEILDAHPAGRKTKNTYSDIYSIGVTVLDLVVEDINLFETKEGINQDRFKLSSYYAIIGKSKFSDNLKPLIKGCMSDNLSERWNLRFIEDWCSGRTLPSKVVHPSHEISSPISFNAQNFSNFKSLASALYNNWDAGQGFINEERLLRWVQRSVGKNKDIDFINDLLSRESSVSKYVNSLIDRDDKLFKIITALDKNGPLRFNGLAFCIYSIPELYLYAFNKNQKNIIDIIIDIFQRKRWEVLIKIDPNIDWDDRYINLISSINNFYDTKVPGHSNARILYTINPSLPCLSPLVINSYVTDVNELLEILERIALKNPEKLVFDDHILSFIAAKSNIKKDFFVKSYKSLPNLLSGSPSYALAMLSLALRSNRKINLPNISTYFEKYLVEIVDDVINNKKIRNSLVDDIKQAASRFDFDKMVALMSNQNIFHADQNGYFRALNEVKSLDKRISMLSNNNKVGSYGTLFGQRITVLVSYCLLIIITLAMVF